MGSWSWCACAIPAYVSPPGGGINAARLLNANKAEGYGFEMNGEARPVEHLQLTAGLSYNHTKIDDPNLFKYPVAFMWEPGFWNLTDREAESFRAYLLKGGFAIFEDFDGTTQWANFEAQMRRVLPEGRLIRLDSSHQIFNAFFPIEDIDAIVHPMSHIRPSYYGIFEDNDPSRRLLVVANFDNHVPHDAERSSRELFPFDASTEAYKLGVNYMIYGLSH